jgi:hypothetical protein
MTSGIEATVSLNGKGGGVMRDAGDSNCVYEIGIDEMRQTGTARGSGCTISNAV